MTAFVRPNKSIPVFRVTQPYLNLLVKPGIFTGLLEKKITLCILKGEMPFKMHKIIFFSRKKYIKKMCAYPTQKLSDLLTETHLFFYLALSAELFLIQYLEFMVKELKH